eukprot:gene18850-26690_t
MSLIQYWINFRQSIVSFHAILNKSPLINLESISMENIASKIHTSQIFDWDCGLACCSMVLKWNEKHVNIISEEMLMKSKPLWTIELFIILNELDVESIMLTKYVGIHSDHAKLDFYGEILEAEAQFIEAQFQYASEK